jgi:NAD-dependent dihydropyrimidine dehydrogenase PreA subunit
MPSLSYRMLYVGTAPAGFLGLEELFNELSQAGATPKDADIGDKLLSGVKKNNFIPKPAANDFKTALLREFVKFYTARKGGKAIVARNYGEWEGYPRENIPWFPTISMDLCDGCEECMKICPKEVFEKGDNGKVIVVEPFLCIVGCCFCKSACKPKAILMPLRDMLDTYRHMKYK